MGWKNWPAWLKGGIIGIVIGVLLWALFLLLVNKGNNTGLEIIFMPFLMLNLIVAILSGLPFDGNPTLFETTSFIILSLATYFIIGAVFGLIIGKIKSNYTSKQ